MDHREFPDTIRRRTVLDIIQTSQECKWSLIKKRMDISNLFFWAQVSPRPQSWDTGTYSYRSISRSLTTSNWRNSELKPSDGKSDYTHTGSLPYFLIQRMFVNIQADCFGRGQYICHKSHVTKLDIRQIRFSVGYWLPALGLISNSWLNWLIAPKMLNWMTQFRLHYSVYSGLQLLTISFYY